MLPFSRQARPDVGAPLHVRHRPKRTLLYQLSARGFIAILAEPEPEAGW